MEFMYVKYVNGKRFSIIKDGENIIMNDSKIIPFDSIKNQKENKDECVPHYNKKYKNNLNSTDKIDEEITNYFFNAIHKNYLTHREE